MIRKQLTLACYAMLIVGALLVLMGAGGFSGASRSAAGDLAAQVTNFTIDIAELTIHLRDKPQKEVEDQVRDWAVYGTLVQLGVDSDAMAKATFKTAPMRLPYLDEAFLFDYGRGRRALVSSDVFLFYDHDDPDPTATLGRLADKVRMEIGEIPATFQVFMIVPELSKSEIVVERRPSVTGTAMFSPEYGYVEQSVPRLEDFAGWLDQIDDVSFAGIKDGALRLGGRRFPKSRTKGVTVEDVAALLQAHEDLESRRESLKVAFEQLNDGYNVNIRIHRPSPSEVEQARARYQKDVESLAQYIPEAPGFSLDPQWRQEALVRKLERLAVDPCGAGLEALQGHGALQPADAKSLARSEAEDVDLALSLSGNAKAACASIVREYGATFRALAQAVRAAGSNARLVDAAMIPFWRLRGELRAKAEFDQVGLLKVILDAVRSADQVQCARYDGPLQGTRVGMNLFYTDLLAKLWESVDYHHSAPTAFVSGFISSPRMNLEASWKEEQQRLPSTRIWFGPRPESYTLGYDGGAIWFEHIATRVFAAGSDPARPDAEEQPAESSRRAFGFWDRHFKDVADYEPQYHVQNQIMKWSLVTGLHRNSLSFLKGVTVGHDLVFDRWYAAERGTLRYKHDIALRPRSEGAPGAECLDLLGSYPFESSGDLHQISGGVGLGGRKALDVVPRIELSGPPGLRHVFPDAAKGPGTAARVRPRYAGPREVISTLSPTTRARTGVADLKLAKIEISFTRGAANDARIALKTDVGEIGTVIGRPSGPARIALGWHQSGVETSLHGGERVAARGALEGERLGALQRPASRAPITFDDRAEVLVQERGSDGALRITTGKHASLGESEFLSVSSRTSTEARIAAMPTSDVALLLDQYPWQKLTVRSEGATLEVPQSIRRTFQKGGPPEGARRVTLTGIDGIPHGIEVHITSNGEVFVARPGSAQELAVWRDLDERGALTGQDVRRLVDKTDEGVTTVRREDLSNPAVERAYEAFADGAPQKALELLSSSSVGDARKFSEAFQDLRAKALTGARFQAHAGNRAEAGRLYGRLSETFGSLSPWEQMHAAVAHIEAGNAARGIEMLGDLRRLNAEELDALARATSRPGVEEIHGFFAARREAASVLFGARAEALELIAEGVEARSALHRARIEGSVLDDVERRMLIADRHEPTAVYLHDGSFRLNRHDFEASSNGTAAELAKSPTMSWRQVESAGEVYAPGVVIEANGARYHRVGTIGGEARAGRPPVLVSRAVFIRNCDRDGDGALSESEKLACAA